MQYGLVVEVFVEKRKNILKSGGCGKIAKKYSLLFMNTFKSLEFAFNNDCATHILIHCDMHIMFGRGCGCGDDERSG